MKRRVFCVSDLHVGVSSDGDRAVMRLAALIKERAQPGDVIALLGDISSSTDTFVQALRWFHVPGMHGIFILGNHDLWLSSGEVSSVSRLRMLHDIGRDMGWTPIQDAPLVLEGCAFVGSIGWYDGSFRDTGLAIPDEAYQDLSAMIDGHRLAWADKLYVRWGTSDAEVTQRLLRELRHQLERLTCDGPIIALTHHLPTYRLRPYNALREALPGLFPKQWRFLNAFLGSNCFGELLAKDPRVTSVVSGHVHWRGKVALRKDLTAYTIGGDYRAKELLILQDGRRFQRLRVR